LERCIAYVSNVEPEITIVLSPIITTPRQQDRATRFIGINDAACGVIVLLIHLEATVPTVGDAIEALTDFCDELLETLKQMTAISAELEARDHVQVEDIHQVCHYRRDRITKPHRFRLQIDSLQDVNNIGDLDIGQKRALICRELERNLSRTRNTANILLCEPAIFTLCCHN
jgi:nuclear pore complex protein Nup205